jgi:transglutaminase-like putative cysteine protease
VRLDVGCSIGFRAPWPTPAVLMLSPQTGEAQTVVAEQFTVDPPVEHHQFVDTYGNLCQRLVMPAGSSTVRASAVVDTADDVDVDMTAPRSTLDSVPSWVLQYCLPSRYCPSDLLRTRAVEITAGALPGYPQVEAIREWIAATIRYEYGTSDSSTWALDTVESGVGVCRDFAHLGIALCRAIEIPARMVVGYLHELVPMDQHAWWEAYVGGRWFTFDATQSQPKGNRVAVAYGRDAADVAFVTQFGPLELTDMFVTVGPASSPAA